MCFFHHVLTTSSTAIWPCRPLHITWISAAVFTLIWRAFAIFRSDSLLDKRKKDCWKKKNLKPLFVIKGKYWYWDNIRILSHLVFFEKKEATLNNGMKPFWWIYSDGLNQNQIHKNEEKEQKIDFCLIWEIIYIFVSYEKLHMSWPSCQVQ